MNREGVDYITFGAVALNLHGIVRATTGADFFIKPDRDNIERLKRALRSVWNDPHIKEITADDLLGDYRSITYGPPKKVSLSTFLHDLVKLGSRFDLKAFNDTVVLGGNMSLDVLAKNVEEYIRLNKASIGGPARK